MSSDTANIIAHTRAWIDRAVIGLNLCPFAKAVQVKGQVRYVLCTATDTAELLSSLCDELDYLAKVDPAQTDTTLLIHPGVLSDFLDFNDFLAVADAAVEELGLEGVLQVASFHPQFQFADTDINDVSNATNRSPYPTLHLIRESSIERAVEGRKYFRGQYRKTRTARGRGLGGAPSAMPTGRQRRLIACCA
jgi:hypothetical protein